MCYFTFWVVFHGVYSKCAHNRQTTIHAKSHHCNAPPWCTTSLSRPYRIIELYTSRYTHMCTFPRTLKRVVSDYHLLCLFRRLHGACVLINACQNLVSHQCADLIPKFIFMIFSEVLITYSVNASKWVSIRKRSRPRPQHSVTNNHPKQSEEGKVADLDFPQSFQR